jgi:hypothetical protein
VTIRRFVPEFARHVVGFYEERVFDEDGVPEPVQWMASCSRCGVTYGIAKCPSGRVEMKISMFAKGHIRCPSV